MASPFARAWWSFDLGKYRPCSGTYQLYPPESVPPLGRAFDGSFDWLRKSAEAAHEPTGERELSGEYFSRLEADARRVGVTLPESFFRFFRDAKLRAAIPSCTACEWDPGGALRPSKVEEGAVTLRLLRDQQDCLFWYLYLTPEGASEVICSPIPFDDPEVEVERDVILANTWWVAPDLESFVYRFWIENILWFELDKKAPHLTAEQRAYVAFYERSPAA